MVNLSILKKDEANKIIQSYINYFMKLKILDYLAFSSKVKSTLNIISLSH